jgi:hypothetical protein
MTDPRTAAAPDGITVSNPAPGVFVGQIVGHYSETMLRVYLRAMDEALAGREPMFGFHDWQEMTSYETVCRTTMTEWVRARRSRLAAQQILVRSRIVAMGVATANLLLGGNAIVSHTDRAVFERSIRAVFPAWG